MSLAELLIDFVPRDEYLIYGTLSREWHRLWKQRGRAALSNIEKFMGCMNLWNFAVANRYRWCPCADMTVRHAAPEVLESICDNPVMHRPYNRFERLPNKEALVKNAFRLGRVEMLDYFRSRGVDFDDLTIVSQFVSLSPRAITWMRRYGYHVELPRRFVWPQYAYNF